MQTPVLNIFLFSKISGKDVNVLFVYTETYKEEMT